MSKKKQTLPQTGERRLKILVSSAVYGYEEMLESIYALLETYGYEVMISHKGTIPVDPDVARVFYLRGLMEQLGMGTQTLIAECRELGAKVPVWTAQQNTVSLTIYRAPEPQVEVQLSERQSAFLAATNPGHAYKTSDYAQITGVVARQAQREIGELLEWEFFERHGKGPATVYARTEKAT